MFTFLSSRLEVHPNLHIIIHRTRKKSVVVYVFSGSTLLDTLTALVPTS
jgi:hypothetical protein